jgi:hypothetical protein
MRIIVFALCAALTACGQNYSQGSAVGTITKFSKKGLVFESWEGSINMGGMREEKTEVPDTHTDSKGRTQTNYTTVATMVPNAMGFNAAEPKVVEKINEALVSGRPVKITYRQWFIKPLTISNSHVIQSVEIL